MYAGTKIKQTLPKSIGLIAGGGRLPAIIGAHLQSCGVRVFVIRLSEVDDDALHMFDGVDGRMDKMGRCFEVLKAHNISDIVLIGRVGRPQLRALRPDFVTLKILPHLLWPLLFKGDDALLRAVRRMLEQRGFHLWGAHQLAADLLAPEGVMGAHEPGPQGRADIAKGWGAALAHGQADKGQAIVVQREMILDVEGRDGTDALIARAGKLRIPGGAQPVLVKTVKPNQDRLIDLPTVGPDTVQECFNAGFAGIAVEAGGVLIADKAQMIKLADEQGIFVIGLRA